jgi:hypothetical protein
MATILNLGLVEMIFSSPPEWLACALIKAKPREPWHFPPRDDRTFVASDAELRDLR